MCVRQYFFSSDSILCLKGLLRLGNLQNYHIGPEATGTKNGPDVIFVIAVGPKNAEILPFSATEIRINSSVFFSSSTGSPLLGRCRNTSKVAVVASVYE